MLRYQDFLNKVVEESKKAAREDYKREPFLKGSIAGLDACRDLTPPQLALLLERAIRVHHAAFHHTVVERYWWVNCFLHEVEWVCNVISAVLLNHGMTPIIQPTVRGAQMANFVINCIEEN